jgi:prevent-host-death family protein
MIMVTIQIPIRELHARTGHYIRLASQDTEVIITENGKPAARITPLELTDPAGKTLGVGDGGTNNNRLGRIEKPAAIALKLRALLYAASPLHNAPNDKRRWELAAAAGQQFFTDPNCVQVNFLSTNYKDLFMAQNTTNNLTPRKGANAGIIMTRPYQLNSNVFERANYPVGMANAGEGATCPSQNLIDAFETKSGK